MNNKIIKFVIVIICLFVLQGCNNNYIQPETEPVEVDVEESVADENNVVDWAMYENNELNLSFKYPDYWVGRGPWPDSPNMILNVSNKDFIGGPGDAIPLSLNLEVIDKESYKKPTIIDYVDMITILEPTETSQIDIDNITAQREKYENGAPEMAKAITYLVEIVHNDKIILLTFNYHLKGCLNIPKNEQEECLEQMEVFEQENVDLMDKIISSFEFLE